MSIGMKGDLIGGGYIDTGSVSAIDIDASQNVTIPKLRVTTSLNVTGTATFSGGVSGVGVLNVAYAIYPNTIFNSSGSSMANTGTGTFNWTCPTGVTKVMASVIGGGGGSSTFTCGPTSGGAGGGGVGIYTVVPGTVYSIVIGAGGSGGASGSAGGSSSFAAFCSATGGVGGTPTTTGYVGVGSGGNIRNSPSTSYSYVPPHIASWGNIGGYNSYKAGDGVPLNLDLTSTAPFNWSISAKSSPGAGGNGGVGGTGGVGGAVLITW